MTDEEIYALLQMTEQETQDIAAVVPVFDVIGDLFINQRGTPDGLRMVIAAMRMSADALDAVCTRWQASIDEAQP